MPIAPSTYYDQIHHEPSRREVRDEALKQQIKHVHAGNYGSTGLARCGWRVLVGQESGDSLVLPFLYPTPVGRWSTALANRPHGDGHLPVGGGHRRAALASSQVN